MKKYKYKREHFESDEAFERFRKRQAKAQLSWLKKYEETNPEHREKRLLRQRLYSRYYNQSNFRQSFAEWLKEQYRIEDMRMTSVGRLRAIFSER